LPVAKVYPYTCPAGLPSGQDINFEPVSNESYPGIASVAVNKIRWTSLPEAGRRSETELISWPLLPLTAAFDEFVLNDGRNCQNLLEIENAKNKFVLIDHEQCLCGSTKPADNPLPEMVANGNFLANIIFQIDHELTQRHLD